MTDAYTALTEAVNDTACDLTCIRQLAADVAEDAQNLLEQLRTQGAQS